MNGADEDDADAAGRPSTPATGPGGSPGAAYRIDGRRVLRDAFYRAACDPRRSAVVEACAGAGKTWVLVSRMLRALLEGAAPQDILAITFTRKAAGEMRERLDEWLAEFGSPACPQRRRIEALRERGLSAAEAAAAAPALAGLHERVLLAGRPVQISTFHAWFAQLLRAAPRELLAGLALRPEMEIVDELGAHREAVLRRFHAALLADPALLDDYQALVLRRGRSQALKWLDAAWQQRTEIELADRAGTLMASVPASADAWHEFAGLQHPCQRLRAPRLDGLLRDVARHFAGQSGKVPRQQAQALAAALELADHGECFAAINAALFTLRGSLRKRLDAPGLPELVAHLEDIGRAVVQQQAHEEHGRMVRLSRCLLRELAAYKRQRGLAEMADLEVGALALLRDAESSGWVQQRLDARIRHLLIDEFQDTSPLQWHALHAWLSGYAGAGGGASGQRPPAVFIVGDPKQSIYRFRRAEPRVFEAARRFVVEAFGGVVLDCDHTRRNAPQLLGVLNQVFDTAQRDGGFGGFRPHTTQRGPADGTAAVGAASSNARRWSGSAAGVFALPAVPRAGPPDAAVADFDDERWRDTLTVPRLQPADLPRQREADAVAAAIAALLAARRDLRASDVQVLCRKHESLRLVAQSLAACRLPVAAPEDAQLFDSPEVRDLVALLDALSTPGHALALAQALRSPLFGATDDDLVAIAVEARRAAVEWSAARALADAAAAGAAATVTTVAGTATAGTAAAGTAVASTALAGMAAAGLAAAGSAVAGASARPDGPDGPDGRRAESPPRGDWWRALQTLPDPSPALLRARGLLAQWLPAAQLLPPHDLLDRILEEGDAMARTLAAVPAARRQAAQAAIHALLRESLALDGARYATPYGFVRALKQRRIALPAAAPVDAVQLLTVHGAKGLEAPIVFLMDTQPEPTPAATATLLVDWPVELPYPRRCAFVYAESQVPPTLAGLFADEHAARRREALNGLYVAMTRARDTLVLSATEPHGEEDGPSWWRRVIEAAGGAVGTPPWLAVASSGGALAEVPDAGVLIKTLPAWRPPPPAAAGDEAALAGQADDSPHDPRHRHDGGAAARLGQAVHRALEWLTAAADGGAGDAAAAATAAAREFGSDAQRVRRIVQAVLGSPACARFFGGPALMWAANEVVLGDAGEVLRIDRLVALHGQAPSGPDGPPAGSTGRAAPMRHWWVLDYKLNHRPEALDAHRSQLLRYCRAVARLQPGEPVHGAFITGAGQVVELDAG